MRVIPMFYDRGNGTASISVITEDGVKNYEIRATKSYTKKEIEMERVENNAVGFDGHIEFTPAQETKFLKSNGYLPIKEFVGLKERINKNRTVKP